MPKLHKTPEYHAAMKRLAKVSYMKWGMRVTNETKRQIKAIEQELEKGIDKGKIDEKFHSGRFRYQNTKNSQSVFYEHIDRETFMINLGGSNWPWGQILKGLEPAIDKYIESYKRRKKLQN